MIARAFPRLIQRVLMRNILNDVDVVVARLLGETGYPAAGPEALAAASGKGFASIS